MTLECTRFYQNLKCSGRGRFGITAGRAANYRAFVKSLPRRQNKTPGGFPPGVLLEMSGDRYYQLRCARNMTVQVF